MFSESRLWECRVFPGKGGGPGFSFSCRPSALDRTLFERGRRIFCMHFYRVSWQWGDFWMHFYRVCWNPLMGMSCFLVQKWARVIKVSCFSAHFCLQLSSSSCFACIFCIFCIYACDSVLMRCSLWQTVPESSWFFSRYFHRVCWNPLMGMSCFLVLK